MSQRPTRTAETLERPAPVDARSERVLRLVATVFAVAVLVHNADHLRRGGDSVSADVFWIGTLAIVIEVGVVALVFMRHPSAPLTAAAGGFWLALGYLFVHFTPERSVLSDSFTGGGASPLSIFAASFEAAAAVLLGLAGVNALRRGAPFRIARREHGEGPSLVDALRQPVVAALLVGNVIILAGSLATR